MERVGVAMSAVRRIDQLCCGKMPAVEMQYCTVKVGIVLSCACPPPAIVVDCVAIGAAVAPVVSVA
jgi:hypothetical protein